MPGHVLGDNQDYHLRIGNREFAANFVSNKASGTGSGQVSSNNPAAERLQPVQGMEPGAHFVYFLFLNNLNSDAAWASAELRPNLIVFNWADPVGYFLHAFSFVNLLLSLAAAFLLVFFVRYLAMNYRRIFSIHMPPQSERPGVLFIGGVLAAAVVVCIAYCFPWFHNVVFLYFSLLALAGFAAQRWFFRRSSSLHQAARRPAIHPGYVVALMLILVAALGLRVYKADWGFPLLLHPDEYAVTSLPSQMAVHNSLDPIDFERPNHSSIYLSSVIYGIASEVRFHRPIQETFQDHQVFYTYLSRLSVAVLGVLSVLVAFLIGAEFHPRVGLFAALLFALFPQFVMHSHYVTPDISSALLLQGVVLFSLRYIRSPSPANLLYACACAAGATAEKYPGVLTLLGLMAALWLVHRGNRERFTLMSVRAGLAYLGFVFLLAPFVILKPHVVLLNLISESRPTHPGHDGLGFFGNLSFYVHTYAHSTSIILAVFAVIGLVALWRRHRWNSLPLFLGLVFWVALSKLSLYWERWDLPMVVTPLLLAAYGMNALWVSARGIRSAGLRFATACGLLLLIAVASANLLLKDFVVLADFQAKDTRLIGTVLLSNMGVTQDNTLAGNYTPLAPVWKRGFDFISSFRNAEIMQGRHYAVVSSGLYGRYFLEPAKYPDEVSFYQRLFALPLMLDLKPSPMPERFAAFNDFSNLSRAYPAWRDYRDHHETFSVGAEIRVYRIDSSGSNGGLNGDTLKVNLSNGVSHNDIPGTASTSMESSRG